MRKKILCLSVLASISQAALAADWVTNIDTASYNSSGTITFNDWGYTGPAGVGAMDFQVGAGFNASRLGQIQNVKTVAADYLTPDPASNIRGDLTGTPVMSNANMDGSVNFYRWGYTTPTSYFNNMEIDKAGNYFVAKNNMQFGFYNTFNYHDTTGTNPDMAFDTNINFQPYAISDAKGWCGSTMVTNPAGLSVMAGQVTFDFAFDAYLSNNGPGVGAPPTTQIVPSFIMRSYGDYNVSVTTGTYTQNYIGHAVGNNTNPTSIVAGSGGTLDPAFQNKVSFLGAGVVPKGVWVTAGSFNTDGSEKRKADGTWDVTVVSTANPICDPNALGAAPEAGAVCHQNSFAGYAFLLRADAQRTLTWIAPDGHSDYVTTDPAAYAAIAAVPVPAAVWLFGSGLLGLGGMVTRRRRQSVK